MSFGHLEAHLALDDKHVAVDVHCELVLRHAGQVGVECDAGGVLDDVHRR
jgi:hypothetical protein